MKYWLLTTEYPPLHGGGISTYCYFTARMLDLAGYTVTVFTQDDSVHDFNIGDESKNTRIVRFNSNRDGVAAFLGYTARLSYAFAGIIRMMIEKEGKPDLIEAQDYLGIAYYLTQFKYTRYGFLSDVPIIITLHSPAFIYLEYNRVPTYRFPDFWTGEMEKQSIIAADALISPTRYLAEEIQKHISLTGKEITIIANPYVTDITINFGFKRNKIVYYGKLAPQKGSFALLAYFKELWDNGFQHALHIIGGTDIVYHPEMKTMGQVIKGKYASYLAKGLLRFHDKIKPSQLNEYLGEAHVIIFPSIVDNMPYVVTEAMSLGKIVLASKQGGQNEMIEEGVSGFLFDHDEPSTFGQQLAKILSLTDEVIRRIGENAHKRVKDHYSFKTIQPVKQAFLERVKVSTAPKNHFPFLYQEEIMPLAEIAYSKDLLSVVIPFYNMGDYIEECVQSVFNSSYKKIELLIVNDGSTNATGLDKLRLLGSKKDIIVINTPNRGLAAARNYGAEKASGEFLAFLDADDKVAPAYYHKAVSALKQNGNVFFAGSWVKYFENSNHTWPAFTPQPPYALVHNQVNSSSLVYKRSAFLAGGLNDQKVDYGMEDYESVVQLLSKGFNGVVLPEVLFYYRVRSGSMFRNITREKLLYSNRYIAEKHRSFYTKFAIRIINLLNANGPGHMYDNPTFEISISIKAGRENILFSRLKKFVKKNERLKKIALSLKKKYSL